MALAGTCKEQLPDFKLNRKNNGDTRFLGDHYYIRIYIYMNEVERAVFTLIVKCIFVHFAIDVLQMCYKCATGVL